ncbi:TasA family protein [Neobacillus sp. SAB-20_R2A]|uniref:TasA family protein n=1 Tax=Neobacillus sp. SAB-20_R2A TaxID=3120519 RepID=UPI003C6DF830
MGTRTKLGLGVASAALGLALIGGGTFAYFSDKAETTGTFVNGTLDLNTNPTIMTAINDFKPGDWANRTITLKNDGSLDIAKISLSTENTITNKEGAPANTDDLNKYIRVYFLKNVGSDFVSSGSSEILYGTTLDQLNNKKDEISTQVFGNGVAKNGMKDLYIQFQFIDNNEDQNQFQGDAIAIKWTFEGRQGAGQAK